MRGRGGPAIRALRWGLRYLRGFEPQLRDAPVILMYHRVAEPPWDPWGLAVPPALFREQILALKRRRALLSMDDLVAGLESGSLPPRATALTFDDGYADNALVAKPILEELEAPATLFLTSGIVGEKRGFWWDELARLVLAGRSGADFAIDAGGERLAATWPEQAELPADLGSWRVNHRTDDPRRQAYLHLWRILQAMTAERRDAAMTRLTDLLSSGAPEFDDLLCRPMTPEMVRAAPSRWIAIGAHGRSHTPLTALPLATRREELEGARDEIAALTGAEPPSGLAYPHGSFDAETRALVAEAGYRWAVISRSARIDPRCFDPLALPRLEAGPRDARGMLRSVHAAGR